MEFFKELWLNQPNTFIGIGLGILVFLGIYIKLLDIYQQFFLKNVKKVPYPGFDTYRKKLLGKLQIEGLIVKMTFLQI